MDVGFWNLFWTTGMPEAWLMSRNGEGPAPGAKPAGGQGLDSPLAAPMGNMPGNPKNLY